MRWMKWIGAFAAVLLVMACTMTWMTLPARGISVSGIDASGTNFGKPGYFHFLSLLFFLPFTFINRIWAKRANLAVTALNMAWAIRNYFIITLCRGGECPETKFAMYLVLVSSLIMLISALFPDFRETKSKMEGE